ncbi:MAG TPA: DUF3592 domain-containing protein [Acidobacteriaceae bacterium]|nr:DUF3592 domain-containing protein [Acidobacteriaceae bacterium]
MPLASNPWHDWWRHVDPFIYLLKWPLAFIAGWAGIHYRRWRKQLAENAAQGWPSVDGRVASGIVKPVPKTRRYLATLTYTYFVGEYRTGTYVHEFQSESDADEFVRAMKDKHVPIRYNESNPDKSVLEQRAIEQHILLAPRFG